MLTVYIHRLKLQVKGHEIEIIKMSKINNCGIIIVYTRVITLPHPAFWTKI